MNILLSVKPEYVKKIIDGEKKYEFRKTIFKKEVSKIYIYSTYPIKKIVSYFEIKSEDIENDAPKTLWEKYQGEAGISEKDFFKYFSNYEKGYAIRVRKLTKLKEAIDPYKIKNFIAPQNFIYLKEDNFILKKIIAFSNIISKSQ